MMMKYLTLSATQGILVAIAIVAVLSVGAGTAFAAGAVHQTADVLRFDGVGGAVGEAKLVRNKSGVSMNIKSSVEGELAEFGALLGEDFTPGDATTNWFIVFNNPGSCAGGCGEDEVLDAIGGGANDAGVDILFATGHVAGSQWRAAAHLSEGDNSGSVFGEAGLGLVDSLAAEIHVIVRSHGPAKNLAPGELDDAIHTLMGGCATNTCGDPQFAVFPPAP